MNDSRSPPPPPFFPGFEPLDAVADGVEFAGVVGGAGVPLLLLHGYPQTHVAWRRIAPALAESHRVVVPDLPGYGASRIRDASERWTKRRVGRALAALMTALGHGPFGVVGHDRGARVGYRTALDHPERVRALASLTVVPTLDAMEGVDHRFALENFHWFLLAQDHDLPERMLAADPDAYLSRTLARMTGGRGFIEPEAVEAYRAAFRRPSVRHAICEDYRAAMHEDLALDRGDRTAGRRLACPVLVSWPQSVETADRPRPIEIWRGWADDVTGGAVSGGHLQPEEAPAEVLALLLPFLARHAGYARS